jgi:hypothetical protein
MTHTQSESMRLIAHKAELAAFKAMERFPQPNYVVAKILEEAGEVGGAYVHMVEAEAGQRTKNPKTREDLEGEIVQLIAMLFRLWVEGDQTIVRAVKENI